MKRERIEVCSLDYLMFAYERMDEGYMEACDRLSAAEMRKSYVEYLRDLASY